MNLPICPVCQKPVSKGFLWRGFKVHHKCYVKATAKWGLLVIALFSGSILYAPQVPAMECRQFLSPMVQCEAHFVWPAVPSWKTYDYATSNGIDRENGLWVAIEVQRDRWSVVEMSVYGLKIMCLARYHNGTVEFSKLP